MFVCSKYKLISTDGNALSNNIVEYYFLRCTQAYERVIALVGELDIYSKYWYHILAVLPLWPKSDFCQNASDISL